MSRSVLLALWVLQAGPDASPAPKPPRSPVVFLHGRLSASAMGCGELRLSALPDGSFGLTFERDDDIPGGQRHLVEYRLTGSKEGEVLRVDRVARAVKRGHGPSWDEAACAKPIQLEISSKAAAPARPAALFTDQDACQASPSAALDLSSCLSALPPIAPPTETTRELRALESRRAVFFRLRPSCRCESWKFEEGQDQEGGLLVLLDPSRPEVHTSQRYALGHDSVVLSGATTSHVYKDGSTDTAMSLCAAEVPVDQLAPGVFQVGDSTWFADRKACEAKQSLGRPRESRCTE